MLEQDWISNEEKEILKQFRERVQDDLPSQELTKSKDDQDAYLLRWLRARNLNLNQAEQMLINALQWRKDNDVDNALDTKLDPYLQENYPWDFAGVDKEGRPVVVSPFSDWDFRKMKDGDFEGFVKRNFEVLMEEIRFQNLKRLPKQAPITQFVTICDTGSFPYSQLLNFRAMKKWYQVASSYEAYYPEILHRAIFINCPPFFKFFLAMFKGIFAPRTLGKIICYSSLAEWKQDVETYVDPAILPEQYGGTRRVGE